MKKLIAIALIASASAQEAVVWPYTAPAIENNYASAMLAIAQEQLETQRKMQRELEYARWRASMERLTRPVTDDYINRTR
jgi:predicted secreted protein